MAGSQARIEVRGGDDWIARNNMDRFIATIELIAAFFVGLVADHGRSGGVDMQLRLAAGTSYGDERRLRHTETILTR